jgi:hypothetical protein
MALSRPDLRRSSPVPLKQQIVDHIAESVARGDLAPGDKLPAGRDLAEDWEVGYSTINGAMKVLTARGVLVAAMGKGTFVAERPELLRLVPGEGRADLAGADGDVQHDKAVRLIAAIMKAPPGGAVNDPSEALLKDRGYLAHVRAGELASNSHVDDHRGLALGGLAAIGDIPGPCLSGRVVVELVAGHLMSPVYTSLIDNGTFHCPVLTYIITG